MLHDNKPNPGSPEATKTGCTCPVIDNHYGAGRPDGTFWINGLCPLHAVQKSEPVVIDDGGECLGCQ